MRRQPPVLTLKTSTILIAKGSRKLIVSSRSELPASLRADLDSAITGPQSCRLLIADRSGRERLMRAADDSPAPVQSPMPDRRRRRFQLTEIALVGLLCLLIAIVATWK
ncbi:MAG: hypothetical protein WKF37_15300 [Bryobacteraceae bacterium]